MGKSATGKDSIFKKLLEDKELKLKHLHILNTVLLTYYELYDLSNMFPRELLRTIHEKQCFNQPMKIMTRMFLDDLAAVEANLSEVRDELFYRIGASDLTNFFTCDFYKELEL